MKAMPDRDDAGEDGKGGRGTAVDAPVADTRQARGVKT